MNSMSANNGSLINGPKPLGSAITKPSKTSIGLLIRPSSASRCMTWLPASSFASAAIFCWSDRPAWVLCREPDYAGWREVSPLSDRLLVLSARHSPVAQLKVAEETQQTVGGTITTWFSIDGIGLSQDFLLQ